MKPNKKQSLKEGKLKDLLMKWVVQFGKQKLDHEFQNDPELKAKKKLADVAFQKFEKDIDDYCKKYGC